MLQAADDHYAIQQPQTLNVGAPGVLANDTIPGGSRRDRRSSSPGLHTERSRSRRTARSPTSPPRASPAATRFTYHVRQGSAVSNTATVTIDVTKENDEARHVRRPRLPDLSGCDGEPRAQRHPGEPERPRAGLGVHARSADRPGRGGTAPAALQAVAGLAADARHRHRDARRVGAVGVTLDRDEPVLDRRS